MESFRCSEQHLESNYNYRREIERQLISSLPESIVTVTQAGKVVRTISSILRLNLLECALLGWLLKRSNYSLRDLTSSANHISLFEQDQNKELLLFILLNAYYVKSFLNKQQAPHIDADVLCMIPQFAKIYQNWRPDSLLKDVSLSELNCTFNSWTLPPKKSKPDYNQYVNKILELSKTYNVAGNEDEGQPKKKRKHNEPSVSHQSPLKEEEEQELVPEPSPEKNFMKKSSNSMWLRSSRMEDNNQLNMDIFGYEEPERAPLDDFLLRRSTRLRSYGFMNFDLDNSKANPGVNSIFAHSIHKTNSKALFTEQKGTQPKPTIKQTSSFDAVME